SRFEILDERGVEILDADVGGVPDDAVESGRIRASVVTRAKDVWKFEIPIERAPVFTSECTTLSLESHAAKERIAGAQMLIQELPAHGRHAGVEPQNRFRKLDGKRIKVDAVDAALEHVRADQLR